MRHRAVTEMYRIMLSGYLYILIKCFTTEQMDFHYPTVLSWQKKKLSKLLNQFLLPDSLYP
jgi:hypothetical protein